MAIRPKINATIQHSTMVYYDPDTFNDYKHDSFMEITADELLERITPVIIETIPNERFIAVDTETFYTGIPSNRMPAHVVRRWIKGKSSNYIPNDFPFCVSISDANGSYAIYDTLQNQFKEFKKLEKALGDTSISKIFHNAGYDMHMLANAGVNMRGRLHDTYILSKLLRSSAFTHSLFDVSKSLQDEAAVVLLFEQMVNAYKSAHRISDYREIPHELMTQYTCADTWNALCVFESLYPKLDEQGLSKLYEIESEILVVAYNMERRGIKIAADYEHELIPTLIQEVEEAETSIYQEAGVTFNINSGKQLEEVLKGLGYGRLIRYKEPTPKMLEKGILEGNPSFDKVEMERLENEGVPLISKIQKYKSSLKLLNTFALKLYEMRDFDYFVHCNFNTIEAKTGRYSISSPSMQNMPRRKDDRVRGAFIAPEDYALYDFDFRAQESLILAHYSRAEYLLDMVRQGHDIHKATASLVFSKSVDQVTPEERSDAKSVGFAITYGAGAGKVANMTHKSVAEAKYIIRTYMKNIPEVDIFIATANKVAKERGRIKTVLGRPVNTEKGREYACVNHIIQGSAADSTKVRMLDIYKFLRANNYKTYMILQVHDSLLQCVHTQEEDFILGYLKWLQTERDLFRVDVTVDVARCVPTWRDKEDINITAVKPPEAQLEKMYAYNIWEEGLFNA